jgi:hypothetical protein
VSAHPGSYFCALTSSSLIAFSGPDAVSFLHAQLTSDVASLGASRTQYSGYCSPKGRLLATCLLWPREDGMIMVLPSELREAIQTRLAKYVLRARVKVADATADYALFGLAGERAAVVAASLCGGRSAALHDVVAREKFGCTQVPLDRYLLLAPAPTAVAIRNALLELADERDESAWTALDVQAGIPVITPVAQEQYVPQMVNLDLIGGVSYSKGCYPGQEIVARTHYLGKLKQRMYRVRTGGDLASAGDALYSAEFGPDQASGAILYANHGATGTEALAVIQKSAAEAGGLRLKSSEGPAIEILSLPYPIPA